MGGLLLPRTAWGAGQVEVRNLGLSRVGENTLLTVILSRSAEPRISSVQTAGKPQLVVEFPQARLGHAPTRLEGDDLLVEQVQAQSSAGGVRITLDLFPDQPYAYWRQSRAGAGGQTLFILGLKTDATAAMERQPRAAPEWQPSKRSPYAAKEAPESGYTPPAAEPSAPEYQPASPPVAVTGSLAEVGRLIPKAGGVLQYLGSDGWAISEAHTYDRPGQRFGRDFVLTNRKYPELAVKILYLQSRAPGTPNIGIVSLTTDNLGGETAAKYRDLRKWTFSQIKQKFEDIGDFFDDALKPLRVKLREQTKSVALKDAAVFENFVKAADPANPQAGAKVMGHVREKVSPRFEGVQYTVSENPLIILNMVDFLYVKVYFLDSR
jgi:hypothetical protein